MSRVHPLAAVLLATVIPVLPLSAQTQRYTLSGDRVAVYNLAGNLEVRPGTGSDVVVELTRGGADAGKLTVESGAIRGRTALRVIYPDDRIVYDGGTGDWESNMEVNDDGTFGDHDSGHRRVTIRSSGRGLAAHADLVVLIPAGRQVDLHLGVGRTVTASKVDSDLLIDVASSDVTADAMRGRLRIDTGSGNVKVNGSTGDLSVDTGSGDVTVTDAKAGRIGLDTGSGDIRLERGQSDDLKVDTGSGTIELVGIQAPNINLDTGSGDITLDLISDIEGLKIDTGSGDVRLSVPENLGAELHIETDQNNIDIGFPIQLIRKDEDGIIAKVGDGRGSIRIETGSGEVRLERSGK
ncbi:MAG: DUF4097 family beta strand repeat-containing protein [Gemmatimonadota bacterium]